MVCDSGATEAKFAAYHEAGHAVMMVLAGIGLASVSLEWHEADEQGPGFYRGLTVPSLGETTSDEDEDAPPPWSVEGQAWLRQQAHISLAGRAAEVLAGRQCSVEGTSDEQVIARWQLSRVRLFEGKRPSNDLTEEDAEVCRLLRQNWAAVEVVAALVQPASECMDRQVDGVEVERAIRRALESGAGQSG